MSSGAEAQYANGKQLMHEGGIEAQAWAGAPGGKGAPVVTGGGGGGGGVVGWGSDEHDAPVYVHGATDVDCSVFEAQLHVPAKLAVYSASPAFSSPQHRVVERTRRPLRVSMLELEPHTGQCVPGSAI